MIHVHLVAGGSGGLVAGVPLSGTAVLVRGAVVAVRFEFRAAASADGDGSAEGFPAGTVVLSFAAAAFSRLGLELLRGRDFVEGLLTLLVDLVPPQSLVQH